MPGDEFIIFFCLPSSSFIIIHDHPFQHQPSSTPIIHTSAIIQSFIDVSTPTHSLTEPPLRPSIALPGLAQFAVVLSTSTESSAIASIAPHHGSPAAQHVAIYFAWFQTYIHQKYDRCTAVVRNVFRRNNFFAILALLSTLFTLVPGGMYAHSGLNQKLDKMTAASGNTTLLKAHPNSTTTLESSDIYDFYLATTCKLWSVNGTVVYSQDFVSECKTSTLTLKLNYNAC